MLHFYLLGMSHDGPFIGYPAVPGISLNKGASRPEARRFATPDAAREFGHRYAIGLEWHVYCEMAAEELVMPPA